MRRNGLFWIAKDYKEEKYVWIMENGGQRTILRRERINVAIWLELNLKEFHCNDK